MFYKSVVSYHCCAFFVSSHSRHCPIFLLGLLNSCLLHLLVLGVA